MPRPRLPWFAAQASNLRRLSTRAAALASGLLDCVEDSVGFASPNLISLLGFAHLFSYLWNASWPSSAGGISTPPLPFLGRPATYPSHRHDLSLSYRNSGSPTHWVGPGIEPAPQRYQGANPVVSQRELLYLLFMLSHQLLPEALASPLPRSCCCCAVSSWELTVL